MDDKILHGQTDQSGEKAGFLRQPYFGVHSFNLLSEHPSGEPIAWADRTEIAHSNVNAKTTYRSRGMPIPPNVGLNVQVRFRPTDTPYCQLHLLDPYRLFFSLATNNRQWREMISSFHRPRASPRTHKGRWKQLSTPGESSSFVHRLDSRWLKAKLSPYHRLARRER